MAFVKLDDEINGITEAYQVVNGQKISAKIVKDEEDFSEAYRIEFPMNYSPNTEIAAYIVANGFTYSKRYVMPNIPPDVDIDDIFSTDNSIKGYVSQKCVISVLINGQTYSKEYEELENVSIPIPKVDVGTQVTITVKNDLGHYCKKNITVKQGKSFVGIMTPVYCANGYVQVYSDNCEKGDIVTVVANGKKYSKKVTSSKADQYIKVKVGEMKNNSIITATVYDLKGNVKGTDKEK